MTIDFAKAEADLAALCDKATRDREVIIISRNDGEDVALIAASELSGLIETIHLLRSPKNAERLLTALDRAMERRESPSSLDDLRHELDHLD
jgi:antitoxin YefM